MVNVPFKLALNWFNCESNAEADMDALFEPPEDMLRKLAELFELRAPSDDDDELRLRLASD